MFLSYEHALLPQKVQYLSKTFYYFRMELPSSQVQTDTFVRIYLSSDHKSFQNGLKRDCFQNLKILELSTQR